MVTALRPVRVRPAIEPVPERTVKRRDIQGLRAVAVVAVILQHAGLPGLPGGFVGVDVFLVISGFVITLSLTREAAVRGQVSILSFYARRIRRILPAASVTIVATVVLTACFLPRTRWFNAGHDAVASSVYAVNWSLAARSVDYLAAEDAPSPLQHFWSLAVEEQFYLVWPVLLALGIAAAAALRRRVRPAGWPGRVPFSPGLLVALLVVVGSLTWSGILTALDPSRAYFVTTTRAWELGVGATLAFGTARTVTLARRWAVPVAWLGLGLVAGSMVLISSDDPFPGWLALVPTLGTAAVIAAAPAAGSAGPGRLLSGARLVAVGDRSYSLYLWHWPVLVVLTYVTGSLGPLWGCLALLVVGVLGWLSYALVERPVLRSRLGAQSPRLTFVLGAALMAAGVLSGWLLLTAVPKPPAAVVSAPQPGAPASLPVPLPRALGARVLADHPELGEPVDHVASITPAVGAASRDNPSVYADGCHQGPRADDARVCRYVYGGAVRRIAIAGDSHAAQWVPALQVLAQQRHWQLDSYTKTSCPVITGTVRTLVGENYDSCRRWNSNLVAALAQTKPDLVVLSSTTYEMAGHPFARSSRAKEAAFSSALGDAWAQLARRGLRVVVIRDTPRMGIPVPECVAQHPRSLTACAVDRAVAVRDDARWREAAEAAGVTPVDLTADICPAARCAPVIGGVLVYRDSHHLTATYAATLAPALAQALGRQ